MPDEVIRADDTAAAAHTRCRRLLVGEALHFRDRRAMTLFIEQCLNGLQFGLLLFLLAAGLTLVFGIMDLVNLAHGSLYMIGAYFAATFAAWTGSFVLGALLALGATLAGRHGGRGDRHAPALWPRPSRPRARHLRPDPVFR